MDSPWRNASPFFSPPPPATSTPIPPASGFRPMSPSNMEHRWSFYSDFEDSGSEPSTAEIIANQSQDYVDEKLAEFQATIHYLADKIGVIPYELALMEENRHPTSNFDKYDLTNPLYQDWFAEWHLTRYSPGIDEDPHWGLTTRFDSHILAIRDEQERVQKKTFLNWINSILNKHVPPLRIDNLIDDLRDGTKLCALLEVLSGEKLQVERGRVLRRPHFLSNANTALQFLKNRRIKLVNIHAADIVDGKPTIILGLIWTIILYFQIEEHTRHLESWRRHGSISSLERSFDASPLLGAEGGPPQQAPVEKKKKIAVAETRGGAKKHLLSWVQSNIERQYNMKVTDFGPCFRDGTVFLAIVHCINPSLVDFERLRHAPSEVKLKTAFQIAEESLGITPLLDAEDVDVEKPDEKSIMTYVAQFLHRYPDPSKNAQTSDSRSRLDRVYEEFSKWLEECSSSLHSLSVSPRDQDLAQRVRRLRKEAESKAKDHAELKRQMYSPSDRGPHPVPEEKWLRMDRQWRFILEKLSELEWSLREPTDDPLLRRILEWVEQAERQAMAGDDFTGFHPQQAHTAVVNTLREYQGFFSNLPRVEAELYSYPETHSEFYSMLDQRMKAIKQCFDKREVRLVYLEKKYSLLSLLATCEGRLREWTTNYGTEAQVKKMLEDYGRFMAHQNIFHAFEKDYKELQSLAKKYSVEPRSETERLLHELAERWGHVAVELRCVPSLLEKVIMFWEKYSSTASALESWMQSAYSMLHSPEDQKLEFFQNVRHYLHSGETLRVKREFEESERELETWISHAEDVLQAPMPSNADEAKRYQEQLRILHEELPAGDELLQRNSRLFQRLVQFVSPDLVQNLMQKLKKNKETMISIHARIPQREFLIQQYLAQQRSIEDGLDEVTDWMKQASEHIRRTLTEGNIAQLQGSLDAHRAFFSRMPYYRSLLESKNNMLDNFIKSTSPEDQIDTRPLEERVDRISDSFNNLAASAQDTEQKLHDGVNSWRKYLDATREMEEYTSAVHRIAAENLQDATPSSLQSKKRILEKTVDLLTVTITSAVAQLESHLPPTEKNQVRQEESTLQRDFMAAKNLVPSLLSRLNFYEERINFLECINAVQAELASENAALNRNEDAQMILQKHQQFFAGDQDSPLALAELKLISMESRVATCGEDQPLKDAARACRETFNAVLQEKSEVLKQIQQIPSQWKEYESKFQEMSEWIVSVEQCIKAIDGEFPSQKEFDKECKKLTSVCRSVGSRKSDMKSLVAQLDHLVSLGPVERAEEEQQKLEKLITKYRSIIPAIEATLDKIKQISKCYAFRETMEKMKCTLEEIKSACSRSALPETYEDALDMVAAQERLVGRLDNIRDTVMATVQRGKDLSRDSAAPGFVQQGVDKLESEWNTVNKVAMERLSKLSGTKSVWTAYRSHRRDILNLLDAAHAEVTKIPGKQDADEIVLEIQSKQVLSTQLKDATEDTLTKLKDLCGNLKSVASPEKGPQMEKEVCEIEERLRQLLKDITDRIDVLNSFRGKWKTFTDELEGIKTWMLATQATLEKLMTMEAAPVTRVKQAKELSVDVALKMEQLGLLERMAQDLAIAEPLLEETTPLEAQLIAIKEMMHTLQKAVITQTEVASQELDHWKKYRELLDEFKPWLDAAELKVVSHAPKPGSLVEANRNLDSWTEFVKEVSSKASVLETLSQECAQRADSGEARDEVSALKSRWERVHQGCVGTQTDLGRFINKWAMVETTAKDLSSFLMGTEREIHQPMEGVSELQLEKLKAITVTLRNKQIELGTLSLACDGILSQMSPEAATEMRENVNSLKAKLVHIQDETRQKKEALAIAVRDKSEVTEKLGSFVAWLQPFTETVDSLGSQPITEISGVRVKTQSLQNEWTDHLPMEQTLETRVLEVCEKLPPQEAKNLRDKLVEVKEKFQKLGKKLEEKKAAIAVAEEFNQELEDIRDAVKVKVLQVNSETPVERCQEILESMKALEPRCVKLKQMAQKTGRQEQLQLVPFEVLTEVEGSLKTAESRVMEQIEHLKKDAAAKEIIVRQQGALNSKLQELKEEVKNLTLPSDSIEGLEKNVKLLDVKLGQLRELEPQKQELCSALEKFSSTGVDVLHIKQPEIQTLWDEVEGELHDLRNREVAVIQLWNECKKLEVPVREVIHNAEKVSSSHVCNSEAETVKELTDAKRNLEALRDARPNVELCLAKYSELQRQMESCPTLFAQMKTSPIQTISHDYQTQVDKVGRVVQSLDSQRIIWSQTKQQIQEVEDWINKTLAELQAVNQENVEPEKTEAKLQQYSDELPFQVATIKTIEEKATMLQEMNDGKPVDSLVAVTEKLRTRIDGLEELAGKAKQQFSDLHAKEGELKDQLKELAHGIAVIREEHAPVESASDLTPFQKVEKMSGQKDRLLAFKSQVPQIAKQCDDLKKAHRNFQSAPLEEELGLLDKKIDSIITVIDNSKDNLVANQQRRFDGELNAAERLFGTVKEKIELCKMDDASDRFSLEAKLTSLKDIESQLAAVDKKLTDLSPSLPEIKSLGNPESIAKYEGLVQLVNTTKNSVNNAKEILQSVVASCTTFESEMRNVQDQLADVEDRCHNFSAKPMTLDTVEETEQLLEGLLSELTKLEPKISRMREAMSSLMIQCPGAQYGEEFEKLIKRKSNCTSKIENSINRVHRFSESARKLDDAMDAARTWLSNFKNRLKTLQEAQKPKSAKALNDKLEELKKLAETKNEGQEKFSDASKQSDNLVLFVPVATRDKIRRQVREMRKDFEDTIDECIRLQRTTETELLHWSSFNEGLDQLSQWLNSMASQFEEEPTSFLDNLGEKKKRLQKFQALLRDVSSQDGILTALKEKHSQLEGSNGSLKSLKDVTESFQKISAEIRKRVDENEAYVAEHDDYNKNVENLSDWLQSLKHSVGDTTEATTTTDSYDGAIARQKDGEEKLANCKRLLDRTKAHTSPAGSKVLETELNDLENQMKAFFAECIDAREKVTAVQKKRVESQGILDNFLEWIQQKENQVKDQPLQSSAEDKAKVFEKLKSIQKEVNDKDQELNSAVSDLRNLNSGFGVQAAQLQTRYINLRSALKDFVARCETNHREHVSFETEVKKITEYLDDIQKRADATSCVEGDSNALKERKKVVEGLLNNMSKEASELEKVVEKGEKLYVHTAPEGREKIRECLKELRDKWDALSEKIQTNITKLDVCLATFMDFSSQQERLTKWLKEIGETIQMHTELRSSLQEKVTQFQNHGVVNSEIERHEPLMNSCCEQARKLMAETGNSQLESAINCIKDLFRSIEGKSAELLKLLEKRVEAHQELQNRQKKFENFLSEFKSTLEENFKRSGEKNELNQRMAALKGLLAKRESGDSLLDGIRRISSEVRKETAPVGADSLEQQVTQLERLWKQLLEETETNVSALEEILSQWKSIESLLETHSNWCRDMEVAFGGMEPQSGLTEKEKLMESLTEKRKQVLMYEPKIDAFMDSLHGLISASGIDRLVAQGTALSSRYQALLISSKECLAKMTSIVEEHERYDQKYLDALTFVLHAEDTLEATVPSSSSCDFMKQQGSHKLNLASSQGGHYPPYDPSAARTGRHFNGFEVTRKRVQTPQNFRQPEFNPPEFREKFGQSFRQPNFHDRHFQPPIEVVQQEFDRRNFKPPKFITGFRPIIRVKRQQDFGSNELKEYKEVPKFRNAHSYMDMERVADENRSLIFDAVENGHDTFSEDQVQWENLEAEIDSRQKLAETAQQEASGFLENLAQTVAWLDATENILNSEVSSPLSPVDLRSKLLRIKALQQEVASRRRLVEGLEEKVGSVASHVPKDVPETVKDAVSRFHTLVSAVKSRILALDTLHESVSQHQDQLQGLQLWLRGKRDQLFVLNESGGSVSALKAALANVEELSTSLNEGNSMLDQLELHSRNKLLEHLPAKAKETVERDIGNCRFELETLSSKVQDTRSTLSERLRQWKSYEAMFDRLMSWLNDSEANVKDFAFKTTVAEKKAQLEKYQALMFVIHKNEPEVDRLSTDGAELSEPRISSTIQQVTSRFQALQTTVKEITKKCEQGVHDHEVFIEKHNQCVEMLNKCRDLFAKCHDSSGSQSGLEKAEGLIKELLDEKPSLLALLNSTIDAGEKLYPTTSPEGTDIIRDQLKELQTSAELFFDQVSNSTREIQAKLSRWKGYKTACEDMQKCLRELQAQVPETVELKATLDEKRAQLQVYRMLLHDVTCNQQALLELKDKADNLAEKSDEDVRFLEGVTKQHQVILARAQACVNRYENIVGDHQQYSKAVLEMLNWMEATNSTVDLWGDCSHERVALHANLERLKNLRVTINEEETRVNQIKQYGDRVLPGTNSEGQGSVLSQVDSCQQEWQGLLSNLDSTIESLASRLAQWDEYEQMRSTLASWLKETDTKLHAIDLCETLPEKMARLSALKVLQGEVRAKELEVDEVTDKAQQLFKSSTQSPQRLSQISELGVKYQQVSFTVKELNTKWQQIVNNHRDFETKLSEAQNWLKNIGGKLAYCSDLSATSQEDLDNKMSTIQDLMLFKEEGFAKIQGTVELAQLVLANTAPNGHEVINEAVDKLQQDWSNLASKMAESKTNLDDAIHRWAGFLEQIQQLNRTVQLVENALADNLPFQSSMAEKRSQLDRLKGLEERVRCERYEVDSLKSKAGEMLESGQQGQAATQAKEILSKFEELADKIKHARAEREVQYRDHRLFKESQDDLISWLSKVREKVPAIRQKNVSDKLAIESAVSALEMLQGKQAEGHVKLEQFLHCGNVIMSSTSPAGQESIKKEIESMKEAFQSLFNEIGVQKNELGNLLSQLRDYKEEYEKISDWLLRTDAYMKASKTILLPSLDEKKVQLDGVKEKFAELESKKEEVQKLSEVSTGLLASNLDSYIQSQLKHLQTRYDVQVNLAKDVLQKVTSIHDQHARYDEFNEKAWKWMNDAKDIIESCSSVARDTEKDLLDSKLEEIQALIRRQDEGQTLVHEAVNMGEKVMRNTRSDGREGIQVQLTEIQAEWDRLIRKMSEAKVGVETALLQWADYSSSCSQLEQWITENEAKLQLMSSKKAGIAKKGAAPGLSSLSYGIGERKASLRRCGSFIQDIVSFEPMIKSVASKAEDLKSANVTASEISSKYRHLSEQAKNLYDKQKSTIEVEQAFVDEGQNFLTWLRTVREALTKCSDLVGDKGSLSTKLTQIQVLEAQTSEGQKKLDDALKLFRESVSATEVEEDKEVMEQEVAILQDEFDSFVSDLEKVKNSLERGVANWSEFDEKYQECSDWLVKAEEEMHSYNEPVDTLEDKQQLVENFQNRLEQIFDWQAQLDDLNQLARTLLETCADSRVSNSVTQLSTKYNAILSLTKEVMRRLEMHYQEHQQHQSMCSECSDWLDKTREKLAELKEVSADPADLEDKLEQLNGVKDSFEQGQHKLRYVVELKERVIANTRESGAARIREETENMKIEFDRLMAEMQEIRQRILDKLSSLQEKAKMVKAFEEWITEIESKASVDMDTPLGDLSERKAMLEKFRTLQREILAHEDLCGRIRDMEGQDDEVNEEAGLCLQKFDNTKNLLKNKIEELETQVKNHEAYWQAHNIASDWLRKMRVELQQNGDSHGSKLVLQEKQGRLGELQESMDEGIRMLQRCLNAWDAYETAKENIGDWLKETEAKLPEKEEDVMEAESCKKLLTEILSHSGLVDDLSDKCEILMELSAQNSIRDETVALQTRYTQLLTRVQAMVSKQDKQMSDFTDYSEALSAMTQWLDVANGTLEDCQRPFHREDELRDRLETIRILSTRLTEGQPLLSSLTSAFTRATPNVDPETEEAMRKEVDEKRKLHEDLKKRVAERRVLLKNKLNQWDDFNDKLNGLTEWLKSTQQRIDSEAQTAAVDVPAIRTTLDRLKLILNEIVGREVDLNILNGLSEVLEMIPQDYQNTVSPVRDNWQQTKESCEKSIARIESELQDHNDYHHALQETEKWLLQTSFQLMAHNSLYVTSRDQVQELMEQHQILVKEMKDYQTTLDDVKAKGEHQLLRYASSVPEVEQTIRLQIGNLQDSYNSLMATASQIMNRLETTMQKFDDYESVLTSITENLDFLHPEIVEATESSVASLEESPARLDHVRELHNKVQGEKNRLAAAVQACEAATASVSRPGSPRDTLPLPLPEREIMVRGRLEEYIDQTQAVEEEIVATPTFQLHMLTSQIQNCMAQLQSTISDLEKLQAAQAALERWIEEGKKKVANWKAKSTRLRPELYLAEMDKIMSLRSDVTDKEGELEELEVKLSFAAPSDADTKLRTSLNELKEQLNDLLDAREQVKAKADSYRQQLVNLSNAFDEIGSLLEAAEDEDVTFDDKLEKLNAMDQALKLQEEEINDLKADALELRTMLADADQETIDDSLKMQDRKLTDLRNRMERRKEVLENAFKGYQSFRHEIQEIVDWIDSKTLPSDAMSFKSPVLEEELTSVKVLETGLKNFEDCDLLLVQKSGVSLLKVCPVSEKEELSGLLEGLEKSLDGLKTSMAESSEELQQTLKMRKEFEQLTNSAKEWLDRANLTLSAELRLTGPSVLEEQLSQVESLQQGATYVKPTVERLGDLSNDFFDTLSAPDQLFMQDSVSNIQARFQAADKSIQDRIDTLKDALDRFQKVQHALRAAEKTLEELKSEIGFLNRPIGWTPEDAQEILSSYETALAKVQAFGVELGNIQKMSKGNIPALLNLFKEQESLMLNIENQIGRARQLVVIRQQFMSVLSDIGSGSVKLSEKLREVDASGETSIDRKLKQYDELLDEVQELEALLVSAEDKGAQISHEGSAIDRNTVNEALAQTRSELSAVKKQIQEQKQSYLAVLEDHHRMSEQVEEAVSGLVALESTVKGRPLLSLNQESVQSELTKQEELSSSLDEALQAFKKVAESVRNQKDQEKLPSALLDRMGEGSVLEKALPEELKKRQKYLEDSVSQRLEYHKLKKELEDWIKEGLALANVSKVNFTHLQEDLEALKAFFVNESSQKEKMQQVQSVSEKIKPSVSSGEQDVLSREVQTLNHELSNLLQLFQERKSLLEKSVSGWKKFQTQLSAVQNVPHIPTIEEMPTSLPVLKSIKQKLESFKAGLQDRTPQKEKVLDEGRALLKVADDPSCEIIQGYLAALESSWDKAMESTSDKLKRYMELIKAWEKMELKLQATANRLDDCERTFKEADSQAAADSKTVIATLQRLESDLNGLSEELGGLNTVISPVRSHLEELKAEDALKQITAQETNLREKHERLKSAVQEKLASITEDLQYQESVRGKINSLSKDVKCLLDDLKDCDPYNPEEAQAEASIKELKTRYEDLSSAVKTLITAVHDSFAKKNACVPTKLNKELSSLELSTESVASKMEDIEREAKRARTDRSMFKRDVADVQSWLEDVESKLEDKSMEPLKLKEYLQRVQGEMAPHAERKDSALKVGRQLKERTTNVNEKELLSVTMKELEDSFERIKGLLEDRFCALAAKDCRSAAKTLNEMVKELGRITEVSSAGVLTEKLAAIEIEKAEIETVILERNGGDTQVPVHYETNNTLGSVLT
ncbi:unnamed protein product [Cyprideis torosa]|uniref:Uncharacterized protein n=1 Tax=Cyprideis torosa TaxID=163714 RepID=A0A7R8W3B8_9CRUS|nr:unnamed protein product [Cyprideis torosa]CAG0880678.1 unnamed protein product [Cyprideis torosa]